MRWQGREQSDNIEDRRGMRVPGGRGTGFGCVGILVVMVIALLTGADPRQLLSLLGAVEQLAPPQAQQQQVPEGLPPADDPQAQFIGVVLKDTENAWNADLPEDGGPLPGADPRPVRRARRLGLRHGLGGGRSLLLPGATARSTSTRRSSASSTSASGRPATSRRRTSSPTRWATTSRTCWASPTR